MYFLAESGYSGLNWDNFDSFGMVGDADGVDRDLSESVKFKRKSFAGKEFRLQMPFVVVTLRDRLKQRMEGVGSGEKIYTKEIQKKYDK